MTYEPEKSGLYISAMSQHALYRVTPDENVSLISAETDVGFLCDVRFAG